MKVNFKAAGRKAARTKQRRPPLFRPRLEQLEDRRLLSANFTLTWREGNWREGGVNINSYAGVGFQLEAVATVYAPKNVTSSDCQAQIDWGDGHTSAGNLVDAGYYSTTLERYHVEGSHVYQQALSGRPIKVSMTGQGRLSGQVGPVQTAEADVAPMPSGIKCGPPPQRQLPSANPTDAVFRSLGQVDWFQAQAGDTTPRLVGTLSAGRNGQPDANAGDFQAWINWGDSSAWTRGTVVFDGIHGWARYKILGSPPYAQPSPRSSYPIVVYVTGPDGTSASYQTCKINVVPSVSASKQTYGTFLLGATWQEQAMNTARRMDVLATDFQNHALAAVDQFFAGVAEWAGSTLRFLAQQPGVPAQQLGDAIVKYMTNNAEDNHGLLYSAASQAVNEMRHNPARFWGKNAVNVLLLARGGLEAIQQARQLAQAAREAETVADTLQKVRSAEISGQLGPATEYQIKVPRLPPGPPPVRLIQAVELAAAKHLPQAVEAEYVAGLLRQIRDASAAAGGNWNFLRLSGTDGSIVFNRNLGYSVVVSPGGRVFTGAIVGTPAASKWGAALVPEVENGQSVFQVDYTKMKAW
jgi:hypothetical protein